MKNRYPFLAKTWLRLVLTAAFATVFALNLQAQNGPAIQWDKTFGGNDTDRPGVVRQTSDGGYIIGGFSMSGVSGDKSQPNFGPTQYADYWVIKVDAGGNKIWDKTFGGSGDDGITALQQTSDGGYILAGVSDSGIGGSKSQASKGSYDYWVIKLDAAGNKLWDKTFGGNDGDYLYSIQQTSDGGYILAGSSYSGVGGDKTQVNWTGNHFYSDYWVVKLNAQGVKVWDKTFGGSSYDDPGSIIQTSDGGYMVGGNSEPAIGGNKSASNKGAKDYWLVKLDANGNKLWDKAIGGTGIDHLRGLQQTTDGWFILSGQSDSGIGGDKSQPCLGVYDYWVVKLDSSGNITWDKTFGGSNADGVPSVLQTSDGGFILGGSSQSGISGDKTQVSKGLSDFWVIKINANGQKLWDKSIGGSNAEGLNSLQQTSDGGYILGGASNSGISGDKTQASKGGNDFWIVKLAADITGIKESNSTELKLYPNPTNGLVNLEFTNPINAEVKVYNALGQCILTKAVSKQQNEIMLDLANAAKGIYTIQVIAEKQRLVKKVVLE